MSGTNHVSQFEAPSLRVKTGVYADGRPIYTFYATPSPAAAVGPVFYASDYGATGDGVTDDTAALQAMLNALATAGGGTGQLGPGVYLISASLTIAADNIRLVGASWATELLAAATFPAASLLVVQAPGGSNFRYGITIAELTLNGNNVAGVGGITLTSTYHAFIQHVRVWQCPAVGIFFTGSAAARGAYTVCLDCAVTNGGAGVAYETFYAENNVVIGGLVAWYNSAGGIGAWLQDGVNQFYGVVFDECQTSVKVASANDNQVLGCQFTRGGNSAFVYLNNAARTLVSNCYFGSYVGGGSGWPMVKVDSAGNNANIVTGCVADVGTGWGDFIQEAGGLGGVNLYTACTIDPALGMALVTGIARSIVGYNPVGHAVAQPAVPATTVAATNTTGVDCMVYVTGGTVTAIAVGGTATGLTSGAFHVLAGESITLTYSAAPTWQWFGE